MCWRDDVRTDRTCSMCGQRYYGDLGHRNCSWLYRQKKPATDKPAEPTDKPKVEAPPPAAK